MDKVLIIAEAGVNHNGSLELAKKLVDAAKEAGADIVKFQTAKLESLVSKSAPMAEYPRMVEVITENGSLTEVDCSYENCPHTQNCTIAQSIQTLTEQ